MPGSVRVLGKDRQMQSESLVHIDLTMWDAIHHISSLQQYLPAAGLSNYMRLHQQEQSLSLTASFAEQSRKSGAKA